MEREERDGTPARAVTEFRTRVPRPGDVPLNAPADGADRCDDCGRDKVAVPGTPGRWVCTNAPGHPTRTARVESVNQARASDSAGVAV